MTAPTKTSVPSLANARWATVLVIPSSREPGGDASPSLDDLAGAITMDADVSGVEVRDPELVGNDVEHVELCVYTVPSALVRLHDDITALASAMGYDVTLRSEEHDDQSWRDMWKQFYRPMVFGRRQLLLRPSWIDRKQGDPCLELVLDPGRAFGTGLHATTQLCLARLCELASLQCSFTSVLDLGCGSGILALAAAKLFPEATRMLAVDVDPEAVEVARENAERNALAARIGLRTRGVEKLGTRDRYALVVANIRTEVLSTASATLLNVTEPGGRLMLSGIVREELDEVRATYLAAGWSIDAQGEGGARHDGIWSALDLRAPR